MKNPSWFDQTPPWVWYACIPIGGGFALVYAGQKVRQPLWAGCGIAMVILTFVCSSTSSTLAQNLTTFIWFSQIATAFALKKEFLVRTYPQNLPLPEDPQLAKSVGTFRPKIDINRCSKDDLVKQLGLPIVYANEIESLHGEGFIFTDVSELIEIIGIPEKTIRRIESLITFSYDYRQEVNYSWKRVNHLSVEDLTILGIDLAVAEAIVRERERGGAYQALLDIKKRTGIPFMAYKILA
ncbi:MAG: helix-hairpin-helix domain-containing protein [Pseudanabaena sp. ELA607]